MQRVITPNDMSSASGFASRFSTTQKAAYRWHVLNRAFAEMRGGGGCGYLFYFIYFIHSFISTILIKFYHVLIFCPFKRVKLIDCHGVNRSDIKPGSGPGVAV